MLSHEPKNYALLEHDGSLMLRGVAFRSSRAEPFGDRFLRHAIGCLLRDDVPGVRAVFLDTISALRTRALPTTDVASRMRLTKSPDEYAATRGVRREIQYEALLAAGRTRWSAGERVHVYRRGTGEGGLAPDEDAIDARDYDVAYYERLLRSTFAERLARAFTPHDFGVVFADADQHSLFDAPLDSIRPVLTTLAAPG
jgi:DNA polymerase elongation subunit (family B)